MEVIIKEEDKQNYRANVGIMLVNKDRKVFIAKRIDVKNDTWQMPQGGIDENENSDIAAIREMKEEIGTDKAQIICKSKHEYFYDLPSNIKGKSWNGKYLGQRQIWYLLKFTGKDEDINIKTKIPEFIEWEWSNINEILPKVVYFKKKVYSAVFEEFTPKLLTDFK